MLDANDSLKSDCSFSSLDKINAIRYPSDVNPHCRIQLLDATPVSRALITSIVNNLSIFFKQSSIIFFPSDGWPTASLI